MAYLLPLLLYLLFFFAFWKASKLDSEMREQLLVQARMIAESIDVNLLKNLAGSESDLNLAQYKIIKDQLYRIESVNLKCRFLYIMGRNDNGDVFFYVDSEPADSEDYSPPGQIYSEVSEAFIKVFEKGVYLTEGPMIDRWGTWVSASVPVNDPDSEEINYVLGMDIDAGQWRWDVAVNSALPVGLMIALLGFIVGAVVILKNRQELKDRAEQFRGLFADSPVSIILRDKDTGEILDANKAAYMSYGLSSLEELKSYAYWLDAPYSKENALKCIRNAISEDVQRFEWCSKKANYDLLWENVCLSKIRIGGLDRVLSTSIDITGIKRIEREQESIRMHLAQAEKLASLGEIGAGIAHELNTPLNVIMGYLEMLQKRLMEDKTSQEYIKISIEEVEFCSDLIKNFLVYARPYEMVDRDVELVDLCDIMAKTIKFFNLELIRGKNINFHYGDNIHKVKVNPNHMTQVFLNLLKNALESIPDKGSIYIDIYNIGEDKVGFSVADTGVGIEEKNLRRIFDPFYTTKRPGKGTGLGLSISFRLMEYYRGKLYAESEPKKGTKIFVELPSAG